MYKTQDLIRQKLSATIRQKYTAGDFRSVIVDLSSVHKEIYLSPANHQYRGTLSIYFSVTDLSIPS